MDYAYDVFLSYPTRERAWVLQLKRNLEACGQSVFVGAEALGLSGSVPDELRTAVDGSRFLCVVVTPESVDSLWVAHEVPSFLGEHREREAMIRLDLADAPVPGSWPDRDSFDFKPMLSFERYKKKYSAKFMELCRRLGIERGRVQPVGVPYISARSDAAESLPAHPEAARAGHAARGDPPRYVHALGVGR